VVEFDELNAAEALSTELSERFGNQVFLAPGNLP
jgi:hypothetical protein